MTEPLYESVGLGRRELVAIVGAGGKTTILRSLGAELTAAGKKVILTTTTKMAPEQIGDEVSWSTDPVDVEQKLTPGTPLFVLGGSTQNRVTGPTADSIDRIFGATSVDYIIVEADGARTKSIKAPADHEPVIPTAATTVIVVMGADALGQPFEVVAHRLDRIAALTGCQADVVVTPRAAADILLHPEGGLRRVPTQARLVMAITKVNPENEPMVTELAGLLRHHPRVDRCITIRRPPN